MLAAPVPVVAFRRSSPPLTACSRTRRRTHSFCRSYPTTPIRLQAEDATSTPDSQLSTVLTKGCKNGHVFAGEHGIWTGHGNNVSLVYGGQYWGASIDGLSFISPSGNICFDDGANNNLVVGIDFTTASAAVPVNVVHPGAIQPGSTRHRCPGCDRCSTSSLRCVGKPHGVPRQPRASTLGFRRLNLVSSAKLPIRAFTGTDVGSW